MILDQVRANIFYDHLTNDNCLPETAFFRVIFCFTNNSCQKSNNLLVSTCVFLQQWVSWIFNQCVLFLIYLALNRRSYFYQINEMIISASKLVVCLRDEGNGNRNCEYTWKIFLYLDIQLTTYNLTSIKSVCKWYETMKSWKSLIIYVTWNKS